MQTNRIRGLVPRGWIYLAQIMGMLISIISIAVTIYFAQSLLDPNSAQNNGETLTDRMNTSALFTTVIAVLAYFAWKCIYTASIMIHFMRTHDDNEIIANKWVFSALSLSLGGFFTPMILGMLPSQNVTSTINHKTYLSRHMGYTTFIGGAIWLATAIAVMSHFDTLNNADSIYKTINVVIPAILMGFGIISIALFATKRAENNYDQKGFYSVLLHFVAGIWMFILTIELIFVAIMAVLRVVVAFIDMFQAFGQGNGLMKALRIINAIFRLFMSIAYMFFIMKMVGETISGLWHKPMDMHFKSYAGLSDLQNKSHDTNNNM